TRWVVFEGVKSVSVGGWRVSSKGNGSVRKSHQVFQAEAALGMRGRLRWKSGRVAGVGDGRRLRESWRIQDDDIDAAVAGSAIRRVVGSDRMKLRVTSGREAVGCDLIAIDQQANQVRSAGGGQLPVGSELLVVDGDVVGMPLDAQRFFAFLEDGGETVDG